jgi:hypothetical protein
MSSKRRLRRRVCTRKRRHATDNNARVELFMIRKNHGYTGHLNVYRCPFCNGFHVGHTPRKNGIGSGWA